MLNTFKNPAFLTLLGISATHVPKKGELEMMPVKSKKFLWILIVAALFIILSGCIDMDLDLTLDNDGSGRAKISIGAQDAMYNEFVEELVEEMKADNPGVSISQNIVDNKMVAELDVPFNNVRELDEYGFDVRHTKTDGIHRIEIARVEGANVSATVNMPGKVTDTNGNASGSTVTWETSSMTGAYWAESEESGSILLTIIMIAAAVLLIVIIVLVFMMKGKSKTPSYAAAGGPQGKFCINCGNPMGPQENFCNTCGTKNS